MDEVGNALAGGQNAVSNPGGLPDAGGLAGPGNDAGATGAAAAPANAGSEGGKEAGKEGRTDGASGKLDDAGKKTDGAGGKSVSEPEGADARAKEAELNAAWEAFAGAIDPAAGVDAEIVKDFAQSAREMGISPEQAKKLVDWQLGLSRRAAAELREKGLSELRRDWGAQTEARLNRALELATWVDRHFPDAEFTKTITKFGISNDANFVRGMYLLASHLDEDSLASIHNSGNPHAEESALDGIRDVFGKYSRR